MNSMNQKGNNEYRAVVMVVVVLVVVMAMGVLRH